jgi:sortase A
MSGGRRVFREVPLLKVGVIMMALALLGAAAVVRVTLGSEPERLVAAEVATKSPGQAPHYSSSEEGSVTKKYSREKDSLRHLSGEESLAYGSSSGEEQVGKGTGQATQQAGEATQEAGQAAHEVGDGASQAARSASDIGGQFTEPAGQAGDAAQLATGGTPEDLGQTVEGTAAPGAQEVLSETTDEASRTVRRVVEESGSIVEQTFSESGEVSEEAVVGEASTSRETSEEKAGVQATPAAERKAEAKEPQAVLQQEDAEPQNSQSEMPQLGSQQTSPEAPSRPQPQPEPLEQTLPGAEQNEVPSGPQPQPQQQPQPHQQEQPLLSGSEERSWPEPTQGELHSANAERHYELLPGAIMDLTIEAIGIYDAPVFDSKSQWALAKGVAHHPQTSLPWSPTAQRNVYLAGHRMGYRGTWSRMIFYNLDKLKPGDEVVLKDRAGTSYRYRVSEVFIVDPTDSWVMGQVRGRDMVTLQTCTPYPTFEKRLIVRADRV